MVFSCVLVMGCAESVAELEEEHSIVEALRSAYPDYDVALDSCEGIEWGQEEELTLVTLENIIGWGILEVDGVPVCAGPIDELMEELSNFSGEEIDEEQVVDSLEDEGSFEVDSSNNKKANELNLAPPQFDPHPQPAIYDEGAKAGEASSDPHPQPATR